MFPASLRHTGEQLKEGAAVHTGEQLKEGAAVQYSEQLKEGAAVQCFLLPCVTQVNS